MVVLCSGCPLPSLNTVEPSGLSSFGFNPVLEGFQLFGPLGARARITFVAMLLSNKVILQNQITFVQLFSF